MFVLPVEAGEHLICHRSRKAKQGEQCENARHSLIPRYVAEKESLALWKCIRCGHHSSLVHFAEDTTGYLLSL